MNASNKDLLTADHADIDRLLNKVFAALRTADCRNTFEMLDLFWARLAMHIRAEHLHLFPALLSSIRSGEGAIKNGGPSLNSVTDVIEQPRSDHDHFMKELAGLIKQRRELIANEKPDASRKLAKVTKRLEDLRIRLRAHDELEESEIYTLVDLIFGPAEVVRLNAQIKRELENLPPRFVGHANAGI